MHTYVKAIIAAFFVFFVITIYALEFKHFSLIFDVKSLIFLSLGIGLLIGIFIAFKFYHKAEELVDKMAIIAGSVILPCLLMPLVMSLGNRLLAPGEATKKSYEFIKEEAYTSSRFGMLEGMPESIDGYHVFFVRNGIYERIKSPKSISGNLKKGSHLKLPVKKGLFGWEFVEL